MLWGEKCFNQQSSRKSGVFGDLKDNDFALITSVIGNLDMHPYITDDHVYRAVVIVLIKQHPVGHLWRAGASI